MKASILITSFNRPHLLEFGLGSLIRQEFNTNEVEVIVLNDGNPNDGTEEVCKAVADKLNIKYFAAKHNNGWRVPGFAINHGFKRSSGEFIFLSCAEMYHVDNTIETMVLALQQNKKRLVIPRAKDDNGKFLAKLKMGQVATDADYQSIPDLINVHLPFFMGMNRTDFETIGGYDEDFIGTCWDDNDIVDRMLGVGNSHFRTDVRVVHLYHERLKFNNPEIQAKSDANKRLYYQRKGQNFRNVGKVWGESF